MLSAKQKHIGSLYEDKGLTHLEIECTAPLHHGGNSDRKATKPEWKGEYLGSKCSFHQNLNATHTK